MLEMGHFGWLRKKGKTPIIDIFMAASSDLVDIHVAVKFKLFIRFIKNHLGGYLSGFRKFGVWNI